MRHSNKSHEEQYVLTELLQNEDEKVITQVINFIYYAMEKRKNLCL